jgi:CBS domain-containing protein
MPNSRSEQSEKNVAMSSSNHKEIGPSALAEPISKILRPTRAISSEGSLSAAAALLRSNGSPFLPIVDDGLCKGVVTERSILHAQARGVDLEASLREATEPGLLLPGFTTGAEALRTLADHPEIEGAVVLDGAGRVMGLLLPSDLFPKPPVRLRPPVIGGMATPLGVYLTSGAVSAGPPPWALALTGALLMTLLTAARVTTSLLAPALVTAHFSADVIELFRDFGTLAIFALLLHAIPLAGIHAAEHMVVHAIERDEPLTVDVVARMPRVHPRCGTNLATGAFLIGLGTLDLGLNPAYYQVQVLAGVAFALLFWRRVGALAQYYVTTRKPSRAQIRMGIKSAEELLEKYAKAPLQRPTVLQRIWNSGIAYTAIGGFLTGAAYATFFYAIGCQSLISP